MANKKVLLISPTEIISQSPIQDNIDEKLLAKTLSTVQETGLRQIVGTTLYSGLTDAVYYNVVSGTTIPQLYSDLLSVSKPYLIAKTTSDFLIFNQYKITNKGVLKLNDNTSNNLSEGDLQAVKDYFDNLISTYKQDVIDFLSETNLISTDNDIQVGSEASGWYLGVPTDVCDVPNDLPVVNIDDYVTINVGSFTYTQIGELKNILLISGEEIISNSVIQDNVDVKLLAKTISLVQDVYLKDILTPTLYFGLLDATNQFIQSGTTIPQVYVDLSLFVKPYLINKTVAEFLVPNEYKVTNKGILKLSDTTAVPIDEADLQAVKDYYDNISTTYKKSLLEFLNDNNLVGGCNNDSQITSDATGWYLGNDYLAGIDILPIQSTSPITSITFVGDVLTINTTTLSYPVTINNFSSLTATTFYGDGSNLTGINTSGGDYLPLSGGTVTGNTIFQSGLTANTISATTYFNLPDNVTGYYLPLSGGTVTGNTIFQSGITGNTITSVLDGSFNGIRIGKGRNETSALFNLGIGNQTFNTGTTGQQNTAVGYISSSNLSGGSFNSAYGLYSMETTISGSNNTAIGYGTLQYNNGGNNTSIGFQSLRNTGQSTGNTATDNTANGYRAGRYITSGSYNSILGGIAMGNQTTSSGNTVMGYAALAGGVNSTSNNNVAVGYTALRLNSSGVGNVAIGYGAGENELGSNKLYIHNNNSSTPLIGGDFSARTIDLNGNVKINTLTGTTSKMVVSDINGNLSTLAISSGYTPGYYGAFSDTTSQNVTTANVGVPMKFNTTDLSNGVTMVVNGSGNKSRITFNNTGVYNIQWSAQFVNPTNQEHDVYIWLRKNETDVVGSTGFVGIPKKNASLDGHMLPSWNFLLDVIAGEYYEFIWAATSTSVYISENPVTSFAPSTASIVLTVTQQAGIVSGTGITAINNLTSSVQTLTTGTTGSDFNIVSSVSAHTFNIPDASASARGVITTGAQTIAGQKTFTSQIKIPNTGSQLILSVNSDQTVSGLPTATYPSPTELTYVKGVTSAIQTQLDTKISSFNNINILGYQGLGSTIKGATLDLALNRTFINVSHGTSGRFQITPIYIPTTTTVTGVKFVSGVQGVFTASTYNGIGLYSYNSSTGAATLVTGTADDSTIWKQTANTIVSKAFTGATSIAAGLYFIGSVVNGNTATGGSTQPQIFGTASINATMVTYDFPNSGRLFTHINSQTTLPSTWNMSSGIANQIIFWFSLY